MRSFSISSATPEKPFYGPWNRLLNTMFPPDTSFEIVPQYLPPFMNSRDAADFVLLLLVYVESSPVLIVEVKPPVEFSRPSKRQEADIQMRLRFLDAAAELQIPMLYGISAFGTKITFYKYNKSTNSLIPGIITPNLEGLTDTAPRDWWHWDILEEEGATRFRKIIEEVKGMCSEFLRVA
ncbi:hypothetical protein HWV62_12070 [Athelia sp. TMB]|nr:hypothetical protein HWV62_12070 [Athelia sp. TMB]